MRITSTYAQIVPIASYKIFFHVRINQTILFALIIQVSTLNNCNGSLNLKQQDTNNENCNQEILDSSYVTACGVDKCEPLFDNLHKTQSPNDKPTSTSKVVHIVSSRAGKRFQINHYNTLDTDEHYYAESRVNASLFADTNVKYQRILGFGTTLTDASLINLNSITSEGQTNLIDELFNVQTGLRLNLIHLPIGSTKYSSNNYALDTSDSDDSLVELSTFDLEFRISLVKDILKASGIKKNRIKLFASAFSAPANLKTNNQLTNGGYLKSDKYANYANYLLSFMNQYANEDLNIWALILSNNPSSISEYLTSDEYVKDKQFLNVSSMQMKPSEVVKLIKHIDTSKNKYTSLKDFKLLLLGDYKEFVPWWSDAIFNQAVGDKVAGVAYKTSFTVYSPYDNLVYSMRRHMKKYFLVMEGGVNAPVKLGNWQYAENYINDIIKNIEYGAVGWIEANLGVNMNGGPTVSKEFDSDASIIFDSSTDTYYRNPSLYALGHLSRYVTPGSVRVKLEMFSHPQSQATQHAAFLTPENNLVIFIANNNIEPMAIELGFNTRTKAQLLLETKSFNTFVMKV